MKKNILIICYSFLHKDPRVLRQVEALKGNYNLFTIGLSSVDSNIPNLLLAYKKNSLFLKIVRLFLAIIRQFQLYSTIVSWQYNLSNSVQSLHYDLILCNDVDSLPLAIRISNNKVPVWVDLHEYSPKEFENSFLWRLYFQSYKIWLCNKFLSKAQYISVVCNGIAAEYQSNFNIKTHAIITNAAFFDAKLNPIYPTDSIKIIHHGAAMPNRKIEVMIDMMDYMSDTYELHLMLLVTGEVQRSYFNLLKSRALETGKKIYFLETVPTSQIPAYLNKFDIGLYILEASGFNELFALPNKFFEFIQARLCLAVSPNPEMASIVRQNNLGIVSENYTPQSMATAITNLSIDDIYRHKTQSNHVAWELSANKNMEEMLSIAKTLITNSPVVL